MHHVIRGPEPSRLKRIRLRYTRAWIDYYKERVGNKPTDRRWREFAKDLGVVFYEYCGYCEIYCRGEVDHYRPKNKFPELVYEWNNWVFSCHDCNQNKGDNWPPSGFLDPCSNDTFCGGSQCCFIFDLKTGEVIPHPKLSTPNRSRAQTTIDILGLNLSFRLKIRLDHVSRLETLHNLADSNPRLAAEGFARLSLNSAALNSLTKFYLESKVY